MKKVSSIIQNEKLYNLCFTQNNIALVESVEGKCGLINVSTNEIVGSFDSFFLNEIKYQLFIQRKYEIKKEKEFTNITNYIRIYDPFKEKMIFDNWLLISEYGNLIVVQNPMTLKYHIFNIIKYNVDQNNFSNAYDQVEELYYYNDDRYFVLTKNGKKGFYSRNNELLTDFEYDDIKCEEDFIIFTKGKEKTFKGKTNLEFTSSKFENIMIDSKKSNLIYCKSNSNMEVYYLDSDQINLLFKVGDYDNMQWIKSCCRNGDSVEEAIKYGKVFRTIFYTQKNGKYGLLSVVMKKISKDKYEVLYKDELLKPIYDNILYDQNNFILTKDNKKGLFVGTTQKYKTIYDQIKTLSNQYCAFIKDNNCDIKDVINDQIIVDNCRVIKQINGSIIYEKNGKKGLFNLLETYEYQLFEEYDEIENWGSYFLVTKNAKKGIIYDGKFIVDCNYKSIKAHLAWNDDKYYLLSSSLLNYFSLQTLDNKYKLSKFEKLYYPNIEQKATLFEEEYESIHFFENIMFLTDIEHTYVLDYERKLIKTFPKILNIKTEIMKNNQNEERLFLLDGQYYKYHFGKLELIPTMMQDFYITAYEFENGVIVVNEDDEDIHDKKCKRIEEMKEEDIENTLLTFYNNNPKVQKKYPTLVKKINLKK